VRIELQRTRACVGLFDDDLLIAEPDEFEDSRLPVDMRSAISGPVAARGAVVGAVVVMVGPITAAAMAPRRVGIAVAPASRYC
jgi:hypothetical protein